VSNQYISNFFNRDFFVNSADWLAGEENSISIRPRSLRASRFRLTVDQFSVVFALSVLLLPQLLLIAGIAVWWERRNLAPPAVGDALSEHDYRTGSRAAAWRLCLLQRVLQQGSARPEGPERRTGGHREHRPEISRP